MFWYTFLCVHSRFAIILMGKRKLVGLLSLSSWCLVIYYWQPTIIRMDHAHKWLYWLRFWHCWWSSLFAMAKWVCRILDLGFNSSMFCCALLYVHSSIAIILVGKRELVALLSLSSWCLVVVGWLFLAMGLSAVCDCGISWSYSLTILWLAFKRADGINFSAPCFAMPVGDPFSEETSIKWRLAFLPARHELMGYSSDSQMQCFFLLKLLK